MKPGQAVSLIEAAYRLELTNDEWLGQIAKAGASALGSDRGALIFRYDASGRERIDVGVPVLHQVSPELARQIFDQNDAHPEIARGLSRVFASLRFGSLRRVIEELNFVQFGAILDRHGVDDIVGVNGLDPSGRGCMLAIVDRRRAHSPRTTALWKRLATHISAGNRLRAELDTLVPGSDPASHAEAVLTPNGKVEHATGLAEPRAAREALRDALVRIDAARSERDDPHRCVDLWRGLVAGRWSLVEHFERDGRRYYLAHKNDPELGDDRALTARERQVFGYAELGHSNKLIGYALGLSPTTVSTLLARARKRLDISK